MENIFAYLSMKTLLSQYVFKKGGLTRLMNIVIGNGFICDHLLRVKRKRVYTIGTQTKSVRVCSEES